MKKYIVNDLANQTLTGNLRVDGGLIVTDGTYSIATYKALLTQTDSQTGTTLSDFGGSFIIGETYTILIHQTGDDFSNIGIATGGAPMNESGCIFTAIGSYPANFSNGSTIMSSGSLAVEVLENTLGFDINWSHAPFGGNGYYVGVNNAVGPVCNSFARNRTIVKTQEKNAFNYLNNEFHQLWTAINSFFWKDDTVFLNVYDFDSAMAVDGRLYYTPIEITMKRDMDSTPIALSGTVSSSFPIANTSISLIRNGVNVYSNGTPVTTNNLSEVISTLNSSPYTNFLGTYSDDGAGGIILTMPLWLKRQFADENELTFSIYND